MLCYHTGDKVGHSEEKEVVALVSVSDMSMTTNGILT